MDKYVQAGFLGAGGNGESDQQRTAWWKPKSADSKSSL